MDINRHSLDDLTEGLSVTIERSVSEEDIQAFCELTSDYHPLHTDEAFARKQGFGTVIAQGLLISSYVSALIGMKLPGEKALIMSQSAKYMKPVYPGDELSITGAVKKRDKRFSIIQVKVTILNQNSEKVAEGDVMVQVNDGRAES